MIPRRVVLAVVLLAGAARPVLGQPDWLPPELRKRHGSRAAPGAAGDPCTDRLLVPIAPALRDSGFDQSLDACLRGGWSATGHGTALIDRPDFYGTLDAGLLLEVRYLLLRDLEVGGGARLVDGRFAQNAVVSDGEIGAGPAWLAVAGGLRPRSLGGQPLRLAWGLRLDLPYSDSTYGSTAVTAASPQLAAALGLGRQLALHARIAALLWLVRPPGDVQTRRALAGSSDLVWAPFRVLAVAVGVEGQGGWYGAGLDHLLVRGGLRVPLGCRARLHAGGAAPLAGEERTDVVVEIQFARDL